jgi:hypothetical protein
MAKYNLVFQGQILNGASLEEVKTRVAELFKADAKKTAVLFSGKPIVIKKNLDTDTAQKYLNAFKKAGAVLKAVQLESADDSAVQSPEPEANQPEAAPAPPPSNNLSAGLASLVNYNNVTQAPLSAETRAEENTSGLQLLPKDAGPMTYARAVEPVKIPDTTHLSLSKAQTGSLAEFARTVKAVELPDISELSMSEANTGSLEEFASQPQAIELPDISELDMPALDDTPLSVDSAKPEPAAIPDVSGITMSEAQEGSLEGFEKKPDPVDIPDTSHLDVEKEEKEEPSGKAIFQIN